MMDRRTFLAGITGILPGLKAPCCRPAGAATGGALALAVASNFRSVMPALARTFRQHVGTPVEIRLSFGATGRLHAQIVNGAPYDVFLAADADRPRRLEREGRAVAGTRHPYAIGRLVLFSRDPRLVDSHGEVLKRQDIGPLAIANPRHAPYGRAALETLNHLHLLEAWRPHLVMGENVAQAYHFVVSGAAKLGFVALSNVLESGMTGSQWLVPAALHAPIRQEAILIRDTPLARAFMTFLIGEEARFIIQRYGYDLPAP